VEVEVEEVEIEEGVNVARCRLPPFVAGGSNFFPLYQGFLILSISRIASGVTYQDNLALHRRLSDQLVGTGCLSGWHSCDRWQVSPSTVYQLTIRESFANRDLWGVVDG